MSMDHLIAKLKNLDWYNGQIEMVKEIPAQEPRYAELKPPLPEPLQAYLHQRKIKLYTHQVEAIEKIRAGKNIIITTPTASGKTLAFNLPVFEHLYHDEQATALYLYPLKALANDQLAVIKELEGATKIDLEASVYDGDTPESLRPKIRDQARLILSNPYAIHQYLPWHHKWRRFFKSLKFIILDEAHWYRGVFGSNVAMLLRRLLRILEHYGAQPQFVLSSATIANPQEHSKKLTSKDFEVVSEDGSAHGPKYFLFWNPLKCPNRSVHRQTSDLLALHADEGLQTLCFTVSRKLAELTAMWAKESAPHKKFSAYRAGYLPEERRQIERALKARELDGVAATNALELGIDIGELDSVIISGYPGTIISTWQRAGRAGRGIEPSIVTLVAFENPLDQYFMRHPEAFFSKPHEYAIIDLENEYIVMGHLMCAAAELPLKSQDEKSFGLNMQASLEALERQKLIQKTPLGFVYKGTARPVDVVSLDNISAQNIQVICDGELLETLDLRRAFEEAHEGAVLLHRGETYLIEELDLKSGIARARKEDVDYYTEALSTAEIGILKEEATQSLDHFKLSLGDVHVTEHFIGYRLKRYDKTLGIRELNLPPIDFETMALWFTLPEELRQKIAGAGLDWAGGLHAAEHTLIAMTPFFAMCDRWDIGGLSTPLHPDTHQSTIFIYDGYPGGIGIAEKAYELFSELVKTTYELIRDCACEAGCPSCIYSPKCGNNNEPLDKKAALIILEEIRLCL